MLEPSFDRIIVQLIKPKEVTEGGLFIPGSLNERVSEAIVVAIGKGGRTSEGVLVPPRLKVGMKVLVPRGTGYDVKIGGEDLLILREEEILGNYPDTVTLEWAVETSR